MNKLLKTARLAISACEIDSTEESQLAALTTGRLALRAGLSVDEVWEALRPLRIADFQFVWNHVVDGWYGEKEAN